MEQPVQDCDELSVKSMKIQSTQGDGERDSIRPAGTFTTAMLDSKIP